MSYLEVELFRHLELLKRRCVNIATSKPKTIALIGNGPSAIAHGKDVDAQSMVVRIGTTPFWGEAGVRTDVLVILNWSDPGYRMTNGITPVNQKALDDAKEIWLPMPPEEMERTKADQTSPPPWPSYADFSKEVEQKFVEHRKCVKFPPRIWRELTLKLRSHGADISHSASTGALVLAYIISAYPNSEVRLYGFSHEGWYGHPWKAESRWVRSLPKVTVLA